ncbi:MAG: FAD binding domain-containing protein, partial [Polyangiales bacterium]
DNTLRIGAATTLDTIARGALVRETIPALADAAGFVGSPQVRRMGTLGGNLCLDTRCRYINQSEFFRTALGGCLKSDGDRCHVVPGGTGCVAALSSDTIPVLVALGATVEILGPCGTRTVLVEGLRNADGAQPVSLGSSELLTTIIVPIPAATTLCVVRKWAARRAIDFPLVSLALRLDLSVADPSIVAGGRLVVGVIGPKPRVVPLDSLRGARLDEALATKVGELAHEHARPLPNVPYDPVYRRERLAFEARRAVRTLFARGER